MEKERKVLQMMFPITIVGIFYLGQAVTVLHSLQYQCCHVYMTVKGYASRVG
jgi:hypothetical protein